MDTDSVFQIPPKEKNTGSPQIPVLAMLLISSLISAPLQSSPRFSLSEWQVILIVTPMFLLLIPHPPLAYPDGHAGSTLSEDEEIEYLKAKIRSGADFIVTQLFYDVDNFLRWIRKIRSCGL